MSEGGKFVVRPKVRFSQWEDDNEDQEHETKKVFLPPRKPTIRNITTIENPYKIVTLNEDITSRFPEEKILSENTVFNGEKWLKNGEENDFTDLSSLRKFPKYEFNENQAPSVNSSFSSREEAYQSPKIIQVEVHAEDVPGTFPEEGNPFINSKEHLFLDNGYNFNESAETDFPATPPKEDLSVIEEEFFENEREKTPEPKKFLEDELATRNSEPKSPRKGFKCTRLMNSINRLSKAKSPKKAPPENLRLQNSKFRTRPLGYIQRSATKPKVAGIMPCLKAKVAAKTKLSPVKKTVLRNVTVKPSKVFVGPGVPRPRGNSKSDFEGRKENIPFSEKLSKPEYNSIMCTINKLKEVQKENVVTDLDRLPPIYKSLVNGKVANSLDFPPDEAIFKNLINLSIEDTQMPTRITRSKDPEPRQRDAVPKLSDFFVPKYANEYCTAFCARPRSPSALNNWNAFRISDKIRSWKWNMDFVH